MNNISNDWIWNYPLDELTTKQKLEAISQLSLYIGPEAHYRILKLEASLRPKRHKKIKYQQDTLFENPKIL